MGLGDTCCVHYVEFSHRVVFNARQVDELVGVGDNGHVGSNDAPAGALVNQTTFLRPIDRLPVNVVFNIVCLPFDLFVLSASLLALKMACSCGR